MFYSHTYLAKKGPLGTVWCAAHLQHRLKKSHYTSTDILATVEEIMYPQVPIALRLSGHLLLGVVRIYSKKVDYLFQDCNVALTWLRKALVSVEVNLPEDGRQAPIQSITLPNRFELDALDLDIDLNERDEDNHLSSPEEITLTDQIPCATDPYITIRFDEDIIMGFPHDLTPSIQADLPVGCNLACQDSSSIYTQVRIATPHPVDINLGSQDPGLSNQAEILNTLPVDSNLGNQDHVPSNQPGVLAAKLHDDSSPQNFPEIEVMRDAIHDFNSENNPPAYSDHGYDTTETNRSFDQIMTEKGNPYPNMEDMLTSGEQSLPFQQHSQPPGSAASPADPVIFDIDASFGHVSPELAIQPTPPVEQHQARPSRRRPQLFDSQEITLSKGFMKKALNDSSNLLRKRRNAPCSALDICRLKRLRQEHMFHEPLIAGLAADLCDIYDLSATHAHRLGETFSEPRVGDVTSPQPSVMQSPDASTEASTEPRVAQSPSPSIEPSLAPSQAISGSDIAISPVPEVDMDIEQLRHDKGHFGSNTMSEFMPSPRRDDWTPFSAGTEVVFTPSVAPSTGPHESQLETPMTFSEERLGGGSTCLSDTSELHSAEADGLYFLETDNHTPTGSQETREVDTLSVRTRTVAQYLKRHSPVTSISDELSGDLSLNKILGGKLRKLCARMFYETLVLKSCGLVDVHQQEAYSDITLKLAPRLSKSQI